MEVAGRAWLDRDKDCKCTVSSPKLKLTNNAALHLCTLFRNPQTFPQETTRPSTSLTNVHSP